MGDPYEKETVVGPGVSGADTVEKDAEIEAPGAEETKNDVVRQEDFEYLFKYEYAGRVPFVENRRACSDLYHNITTRKPLLPIRSLFPLRKRSVFFERWLKAPFRFAEMPLFAFVILF